MRRLKLSVSIGLVCFSGVAQANDYTFDPALLGGDGQADISLLNQGTQLPGTYQVDILLNGERVDTREVRFVLENDADGRPRLQPCLSIEMLSSYGVRVEDFPALSDIPVPPAANAGNCARLSAIPQATARFDFNNEQLLLGIPQVSLRPKSRGIAPRVLWNDGVTAFLMNYRLSTQHSESVGGSSGGSSQSHFVDLTPGFNIGPWRLRNATQWQRSGTESGTWKTPYTYLERGLHDSQSRLTLGERFTPGDIFDSVPFRGAMVGTDTAMVPYNLRSFAPVVRGIARTEARVEVKQNGYTVYDSTVVPGPFTLSDLTLGGGASGDLEVTVWEADGAPQRFRVPYTTPAIAVRQGYLQYNLMAGQYRASKPAVTPTPVAQGTLIYGMPWDLTAYGGLQWAQHYQSASLGLGVSLGDWGSLSLDGSQARGQKAGQATEQGGTWRVRYSKLLEATDTSFSLASYQYASTGYNTLSEVLDTYPASAQQGDASWSSLPAGAGSASSSTQRKQLSSVSLSQSIGRLGYIGLNGSRESYWDRPGSSVTFGLGYGVTLGSVSMSFNLSENRSNGGSGNASRNRAANLSLSMPLERWLGGNTRASYQVTSSSGAKDSHQWGLGGRGMDNRLSWDVTQRYTAGSGTPDASLLRSSWSMGRGQLAGNYSYSRTSRQMGADFSGGMVIHPGGITLGQSMGDTVGLVEARGASGVKVSGGSGIKTDHRGYTTYPYLSPYQENSVGLDPSHLSSEAEILQTDTKVVPTQGAVIPVKFATRVGGRALMALTLAGGGTPPFGALAHLDGQTASAGVVGDGGEVYLTGLPDKGTLVVNWGESQQCRVPYALPKTKGEAGVYAMKGVCR